MRKLIILILGFTFTGTILNAQNPSPLLSDSVIVISTYDYDLNYGISMYHRFCPNQKTFNKGNQLIREVFYKNDTLSGKAAIEKFIYYYYKGENLISIETYNGEGTPIKLVKMEYNDNNNLISKTLYNISGSDLIYIGDTTYRYKDKLIGIVSRNEKKKKSSMTKINYADNLIIHSTKFTKYSEVINSITNETVTQKIQDSLLLREDRISISSEGQSDTLSYIYSYDNQGFISEKQILVNNKERSKLRYEYYPDGDLKTETVYLPSGEKIKYFVFNKERKIINFAGFKSILDKE